jgi:hypothetical protein
VWQSCDYAVSVPQRQNVLFKRFWRILWIFCGKKEDAERQVTLLQMESGHLTQKERVRKNYIRINSSQEYLPSFVESAQGSQYFRDVFFGRKRRPKGTYPTKKLTLAKDKEF